MGYLYDIGAIKPYTEHTVGGFYYRVYLDYHIEFIRGDYWFVVANGKIGMSIDGGISVENVIVFADYQKIEFSHIFSNGNLIFATQNKVYKSTNKCKTIVEMSVTDLDGSAYTPVADSTNYRNLCTHSPVTIGGKEVLLTGNYTNVAGLDPTDANIYYCNEDLAEFRVIYKFGHSSRYADPNMGNPDNEVICRHVHGISWDAYTNKFWICTGDQTIDGKYENHWMTAEYVNNNWVFTVIVSGAETSRYKVCTLFFDEDNIYFNVDISEVENELNGAWKVARSSIESEEAFVKKNTSIHPSLPGFQSGMDIVYGITIAIGSIPNVLFVSTDNGNTWQELTITEGFSVDNTFIRPRIENRVIRLDAKNITLTGASYTCHVPTILLYLE